MKRIIGYYILVNILIIAIFSAMFIRPAVQSVGRVRDVVAMQERQLSAYARYEAAFDANVALLEEMAGFVIVKQEELVDVLAAVAGLADTYGLGIDVLSFNAGEAAGGEDFMLLQAHGVYEGCVYAVLHFLGMLGIAPVYKQAVHMEFNEGNAVLRVGFSILGVRE
ncbi:MAG: hypothetical protein FWC16_01670 [Defluviitaleaceae bacterium]|nr:hypothetical protein [Defluviitaleaceae bacterium]MCL2273609.1 hypothetical protein [Defluviitaleaceae bacterium]